MVVAHTPYIYTTQLHLKSFKLKSPSKYVIADKFLKNAIINHWEVAVNVWNCNELKEQCKLMHCLVYWEHVLHVTFIQYPVHLK